MIVFDKIGKCEFELCCNYFKVGYGSSGKYCSSSCSAKVTNRSSPKRKPEGNCIECDKPIPSRDKYCEEHQLIAVKSLTKNNKERICRKCKENNKEFNPKSSICLDCTKEFGGTLNRECQNPDCGLTFSVHNIFAKTKYCSTFCAQQVMHVIKRNQKIQDWLHGSWRGGTDCGISKTIRQYLLEQANYKCTVCGFNERHPSDGSCILEIDHINGDSTDHRPENLKVLCPNHHALTLTYKARNMGKGRQNRYKKAV